MNRVSSLTFYSFIAIVRQFSIRLKFSLDVADFNDMHGHTASYNSLQLVYGNTRTAAFLLAQKLIFGISLGNRSSLPLQEWVLL